MKKRFGKAIRRRRRELDLSQEDLAERAELHRTYISSIERGDRPCLNGHLGPCSADHIGPISLGFTHRPEFQLLCKPCNSAKNNRMTLRDVIHLRQVEAEGEKVISWHSQALWDARKNDVVDDEKALRLSKLLRDNRHTLMSILQKIEAGGHFTFLAAFLNLKEAEHKVEFVNLQVENSRTFFDRINRRYQENKYVKEQKARRFRVAFQSLREYFSKENRNAFVISSSEIDNTVETALSVLQESANTIRELDYEIAALLSNGVRETVEQKYRDIVDKIPPTDPPEFVKAKQELKKAMALVAGKLSEMWNDERYIRTDLDLDIQLD
ncbi:MAG: helix-turn-helix domain-containing protein [Richelia sp. RM1_1_1]|nr:helix-turn-helix domain-containing protein [Richelia sp. RM1_1_1]